MKRVVSLLLLSLTLLSGSVDAQSDCGNGLPCGPVPWSLPILPDLASPTPFPTVLITTAPTTAPTSTGTVTLVPTVTPTPTPTSPLALEPIQDQFATLQSVVEATQETIFDRSTGFDLPGNASNLFGYVLGLQTIHFGVFTPLIQLLFFALFFIVGLKLTFFLLPLFAGLVGVIRKIISFIGEFIPG